MNVPEIRLIPIKKKTLRRGPLLITIALKSATDELEHWLRLAVGLGQHRRTGLSEDVQLGELHHLGGHIDVSDPGLGRGDVLRGDTQVIDGVFQPVLNSSKVGP